MTFFHLLNCAALAIGPYVLTYKYTLLADYNTFWRCCQAALIYIITQGLKLLVLATFFPAVEGAETFVDGLKSCMDLVDFLGFYVIMTYLGAGRGEVRFLVAGLGWAAAELAVTRCIPLWVGARGAEFNWHHIQSSLEANFSLVHHLSAATLVWLWTRQSRSVATATLLLLANFKPLILDCIKRKSEIDAWPMLATNGLYTVSVAVASLFIYISHTRPQNGAHK